MKYYTRSLTAFRTDGEAREEVEVYSQPAKDRLKIIVFNGLLEMAYLKPIHSVIENVIDPLAEKIHRFNCEDNCAVADFRDLETGDWERRETCGRLPICASIDIKHYDLDSANNKIVGKIVLDNDRSI